MLSKASEVLRITRKREIYMVKKNLLRAVALSTAVVMVAGATGCQKEEEGVPVVDLGGFVSEENTSEESTEEVAESSSEEPEISTTEESSAEEVTDSNLPAAIANKYVADTEDHTSFLYRQYSDSSYETEGLFGEFGYVNGPTHSKIMMMYFDGTVVEYCSDDGFGPLYLGDNGRIFSQERDADGSDHVYRMTWDGTNKKIYPSLTGILSHCGDGFICKDDAFGLSYFNPDTENSVSFSNNGQLLSCDGDKCYYYETDFEGVVKVKMCEEAGLGITELGTVTLEELGNELGGFDKNFESDAIYPVCSALTSKYLVTLIGYYAGTGHFFQEAAIVVFPLDGSGEMIYPFFGGESDTFICKETADGIGVYTTNYEGETHCLTIEGNPGDVSDSCYYIKPGECTYDSDSGNIYLYPDNSGVRYTLVEKSEYEQFLGLTDCDWENTSFTVSNIDYADGRVVFTTTRGIRNYEGDIGWRYSFTRQETTEFCKNLKTGKLTMLNQFGPAVE